MFFLEASRSRPRMRPLMMARPAPPNVMKRIEVLECSASKNSVTKLLYLQLFILM